jgi:hypothetical protein
MTTSSTNMDAGAIFGRGISFPPRIGPDGRVAWSAGEENVRECMRIILQTAARLWRRAGDVFVRAKQP